jgi:fibronectin-binding autotransporter adhesin
LSATAASITFNGGTLNTTADITLNSNRGITLTGAGTINTNSGTTLTYGGVITGAGTLTKSGLGTLILSGTNTYSGITTISEGTLEISADRNLGAVPLSATAASITFNGGTLNTTAYITLDAYRGITLTGAGTINTNSERTLTYGGVITGAGTLTKSGLGTLILSGTNTYSGITTISEGTLEISADRNLGAVPTSLTATSITFNGGTLNNTSDIWLDTYRGITLTGAGTINTNGGRPLTYGGVITGAGTLTKAGLGTLTLTGTNTYTGATTISAGTLSVTGTLGSGTYSNTIENSGTLSIGTTNQILSGIISGTGALIKAGDGTLTLSNANTYSGATTISAGTLSVTGTLGSGIYSNTIEINGTLSIGTTDQTLSGIISGTGALTKVGAGTTLTLSNANPYSGPITISDGTLSVTGTLGWGTYSNTIENSGTLSIGTFNQTLSGIISGSGALTKAGAGTLTLTGTGTNTYTGGTTISEGTLSIGRDTRLGAVPLSATAASITFNGGTLNTTASFTLNTNRGITLTGAGTINTNFGTTLIYDGVITGAGTLTKAGARNINIKRHQHLHRSNNYICWNIIGYRNIRKRNLFKYH